MKYHKLAKPLAFVLAAMLAIPPVSAQAVTFADINQAPWPGAEVSINKAAELKLVVGETINGKNYFKPKDPVSLSQACQLAYKLLLETGKAKADASVQATWKTVLDTYNIQSWAHPAVSFCLDKEIITISDLSGFVSGEVNKSATREQAAEILGRALAVGVPSKKATATTTIFKDNANIAADAIPYIALLNAEKIVNGDDTGKFNPKNTLNRTETAVMVTNLYNVLKNAAAEPVVEKPTSATGKISDITNFYVNFENSSAYYLYESSGVTVTLNGSTSSVANLVSLFKEGTAINATITLNSDARITKLAATTSSSVTETTAKETEGKLTNVKYDEDDDTGRIEINGKSSFKVENSRTKTEINGEKSDLEALYDLFKDCKKDDKVIYVEVTLNDDGEVRKIIGKVKNADGKSEGDVEGILTDLDYYREYEEGRLQVDDDDRYDFDDTTTVEIDGDRVDILDLVELFEYTQDYGEELEVILILDQDNDNFATDIEVFTEDYDGSSRDSEEASGTIDSVTFDEDDDEAELKVDGDKYETTYQEKVEVAITDGNGKIDTWEEMYYAYKDGKIMDVTLVIEDGDVVEITGSVTTTAGYLTNFSKDSLRIQGKKSDVVVKYTFTKYDRNKDEENWKKAAEKISVTGLSKVSNLLEFYERWLDDDNTKLGKKDDDDTFFMTVQLDKNGYIKKIEAEYK